MFHKDVRYLENMKTGNIYIWTDRLSKRNDMREFEPDFSEQKEPEIFEELTPAVTENKKEEAGLLTEEFLKTKTKDQLRDYCLKVYDVKLNHMKKEETMIKDILDLQKKRNIEAE